MCGVRPAAHISLKSLASIAGYEISASLASAATDRAQVALSASWVQRGSETEITATYKPNTTSDYVSAVTINTINIDISASLASAATFLDLSGVCKYKCYRSDNDVYLIIKNLSANVAIIGSVIDTPISVSLVGASGTTTKDITYDATTGNAVATITDASYYATAISLDGGATYQMIDHWNDMVYQPSDAFYVSYVTTPYTRMIEFSVYKISGQVTLTVQFGSVQNPLQQGGGTSISGVALQTSLSGGANTLACVGKATITGYSTTDGLEEVIVCAAASAGFAFSHWEVDGEKLTQSDGTAYGISAMIPYELVENKILVAVFTANNANINTETDNTGVLT